MRPTLTYDPLHNPFNNRFNDPVTWRRDEMQAFAYEGLFRDRNQHNIKTRKTDLLACPPSMIAVKQAENNSDAFDPAHWGRLFASGIVLFLLLVASAALLKAF